MTVGVYEHKPNQGFQKGHKKSCDWRGRKHTQGARQKQMSAKLKNPVRYWLGKKRPKHTKETREKMSIAHFGFRHTPEVRRELSLKFRGPNGSNWKGGIYPSNLAQRRSVEYKLWREAVFKRDDYTCVWCGLRFIKGVTGNVTLHADHIKPFAFFPELRFSIDNGRTLCKECHKKTNTYGNNKWTISA